MNYGVVYIVDSPSHIIPSSVGEQQELDLALIELVTHARNVRVFPFGGLASPSSDHRWILQIICFLYYHAEQ